MHIFPEGTEEWLEPCGTVMLVLACLMLVIGVAMFAWRVHDLSTWERTTGEITAAEVTHHQDEGGTEMCSAAYKVSYNVNGVKHELSTKFATSTNDCAAWEQRAATMKGSKTEILFDPKRPDAAYTGGGRTIEFFMGAIISLGLAFPFGIAGFFSRKIGRTMMQRQLTMP